MVYFNLQKNAQTKYFQIYISLVFFPLLGFRLEETEFFFLASLFVVRVRSLSLLSVRPLKTRASWLLQSTTTPQPSVATSIVILFSPFLNFWKLNKSTPRMRCSRRSLNFSLKPTWWILLWKSSRSFFFFQIQIFLFFTFFFFLFFFFSFFFFFFFNSFILLNRK